MIPNPQKMKVSNPDRILRVLERVASGSLSVQIRALGQVETAVKGRAVSLNNNGSLQNFSIGGISEKGRAYLSSLADGGIQVEFVLMSTKIVFYARLLQLNSSGIVVSIPSFLLSIERRKDARFPITVSTRAYIKLTDWYPDIRDPGVTPFFGYQRDLAVLQQVGDVSVGGLSLVSRFPAVCKIFQRGAIVDNAALMLPLTPPLPAKLEIRWVKRIKESIQDFNGQQRTTRAYKFGVQFLNPSEELQYELQKFMARLAVAEAI